MHAVAFNEKLVIYIWTIVSYLLEGTTIINNISNSNKYFSYSRYHIETFAQ